ncbi:host cell factor 2-like [Chironomus tepperi]|uniref:host cell factor 2-like n=1 Tax=Chironomus tepperi TaxID=113505 RepID=UPI00391F7C03
MSFLRAPFSPSLVFLTPNYGSKAVKIKDDNVLFFGGGCNKFRDSVVIYNIPKNSYQKFALNKEQFNFDYTESYVEENQFSGLAAFDMAYIEKDNTVLIYGGITGENGFSDTLYVLENYADLEIIQTIGDAPSPRIGHTFTKVNEKKIVLFGGVENTCNVRYEIIPKFLNDIYILHINESYYRWEKIKQQNFEEPCGRESHSTVLYKNKLIIYGGMNGKKRLNDLWMLDLNTYTWIKLNTTGTIPLARSMHTATLVHNEMYIFGGFIHERSKSWKCTSSIQCLDLETYKWKNFPSSNRPNARAGHVAIENYGRIHIWSGRDDSEFDETQPIKCHNDVWYFETRKPLRVTDLKVIKQDRKSFRLEWSPSTNAILYVVELKEIEEPKMETKIEAMIVEEEEIIILEDHPANIVVAKAEKHDKVTSTKPKIIIHENILLTPPNTIDTEHLFNNSSSHGCEIINIVSDNQSTKIDQLDGATDVEIEQIESETTDSELETFLASSSKNKNIRKNCWYLVGIFKNNSCKIKNYNSHILNKQTISSDCIPNLIGSKLVPIESGRTYCVRVSALNSIGLSEMSEMVKVKTKEDEPIYNLELLSYLDFYILKWNSTFTDVEFLVSFEINTEQYVNSVTIYKGTANQCEISKNLLEKTRISNEFTINIRAISTDGHILHETELQCSI